MKNVNKVKLIVFAGMMVAIQIVLARVFAINIGPTLRITISQTPIYLAGFWFGPVIGGICGLLGDLLGCFIQGYAPNPFITVSSVLTGVLPGIMLMKVTKKPNLGHVFAMATLNGLAGSLGFTCVGLHLYYGTPWSVLYAGRIPQTILLTIANGLLVFFLYKSPLTAYVRKSLASGTAEVHVNTADKSVK